MAKNVMQKCRANEIDLITVCDSFRNSEKKVEHSREESPLATSRGWLQ